MAGKRELLLARAPDNGASSHRSRGPPDLLPQAVSAYTYAYDASRRSSRSPSFSLLGARLSALAHRVLGIGTV